MNFILFSAFNHTPESCPRTKTPALRGGKARQSRSYIYGFNATYDQLMPSGSVNLFSRSML